MYIITFLFKELNSRVIYSLLSYLTICSLEIIFYTINGHILQYILYSILFYLYLT